MALSIIEASWQSVGRLCHLPATATHGSLRTPALPPGLTPPTGLGPGVPEQDQTKGKVGDVSARHPAGPLVPPQC